MKKIVTWWGSYVWQRHPPTHRNLPALLLSGVIQANLGTQWKNASIFKPVRECQEFEESQGLLLTKSAYHNSIVAATYQE